MCVCVCPPGFRPLFEVTRNPSVDLTLHEFLCALGGVDSVDDESQWDVLHFDADKLPSHVTTEVCPSPVCAARAPCDAVSLRRNNPITPITCTTTGPTWRP